MLTCKGRVPPPRGLPLINSYPSPPVYTNSRHPSPRPAPAPLRQAELENPGDAVRILAATASDAVPVDMRGRERAPGRLCGWSDWSPVQEGLISPVDAGALFSLCVDMESKELIKQVLSPSSSLLSSPPCATGRAFRAVDSYSQRTYSTGSYCVYSGKI